MKILPKGAASRIRIGKIFPPAGESNTIRRRKENMRALAYADHEFTDAQKKDTIRRLVKPLKIGSWFVRDRLTDLIPLFPKD